MQKKNKIIEKFVYLENSVYDSLYILNKKWEYQNYFQHLYIDMIKYF